MSSREVKEKQVWFDRNGSWRLDRQIHIISVDTSGQKEPIVTYRVGNQTFKAPAKKFSDPRYSLIK